MAINADDLECQRLVLFKFARSRGLSSEDAEDLVQDVFLKALRKSHQFEEGTNLRGWLMSILKSTIINDHYARQRRPSTLALEEWEMEHKGSSMSSAEDDVLAEISDPILRAAMLSLSPDFREAVYRREVLGESYKVIALAMDCPPGTVMSRLFRGRRRLRVLLSDYVRDDNA